MATETQVSKKYRVLTDAANDKWDRVSFWTKAADVENTAGSNLQSTVGAIKGITTSLSTTQTGYALDASVASKISGGTDITKAEWDALPDSAKNTGTYYITDYDVEPVQKQIDDITQNLTDYREWKLVGSATGNNQINLPSNFNELYIQIDYGTPNKNGVSTIIPKNVLSDNTTTYWLGGYASSDNYVGASIDITLGAVFISRIKSNSGDKLSQSTIRVYYR